MGRLDARDLAHDGVGDRVNDVDPVPGGIALEDANLAGALGRQRQRKEHDRQRHQTALNSCHHQVLAKNGSMYTLAMRQSCIGPETPRHSIPRKLQTVTDRGVAYCHSPHAPVNSIIFSFDFPPAHPVGDHLPFRSRNEFQCLPPLW